jgi:hypothetical protein
MTKKTWESQMAVSPEETDIEELELPFWDSEGRRMSKRERRRLRNLIMKNE